MKWFGSFPIHLLFFALTLMAQFFKSLTCIVLGYNLGADGDITSAFRQKCFSCTVNRVNWVVKFQPTTFKISWIFAARNYMQTWLTIIQITTNWSYHDRLRLHGYLWHTVRHKDIQDDTHIVLVEALTLFQSGETYYAHNIGFSSPSFESQWQPLSCTYCKVASSRPIYYSIFEHFWVAKN